MTKLKIIYLVEKVALFSILFFLISSFINSSNRKIIKKTAIETYDAIIVPGVPFNNGKWSNIMQMRVYWSYYLYKKGIAKNIIYSGSAVYSPYVEAKIMAIYAIELGIPPSNIFVETKAEHSTENLYYSYKIAQKNGFSKIALATDPFQNSFLEPFSKKIPLGGDIAFIPISFLDLKKIEMSSPPIKPSSAFITNFVSLPNRQNLLTRWRGTLGKHIEYEKDISPKKK